ncbi:hypothetical protein PHYSODRAFT_524913 [Phytophthora sojae]|uniref:Crinkler effector protein N-terminal domain-containing protein n=1 Tax=Phytophthora sojae (strain P6497) TaxID=1094619 RepID=G5A6A3_PHYSP|nr:hypothetical protein PHYSODRAFT_524913 [Phytophthora sojae]EGZ08858.1 hypothetical protein PHYSODRAFT_524913 [Phytophthora sojae]|eukprot:XP_009535491.1 hypothetical protein PHYSODRAFT_524913 [Phytophthora sojae]
MEPAVLNATLPIKVFCGVFRAARVLSVETEFNADVGNVRDALGDKLDIRPRELNLYLAKKNGQWVKADEKLEDFLLRGKSGDLELQRVWPRLKLSTFFEPKSGGIHLLVEPPQHHTYIRKHPSLHKLSLPDFKKSCNKSGLLPQTGDFLKLFEWDDSDCGDVKDIRAIGEILGFTGSQFYIRKEILCVLASFKKIFYKKLTDTNTKLGEQFILMGSPGTGKSCIVALICFYFAIEKNAPVVWHRKSDTMNGGLAVTRLFDQGNYYEWIDLAGHAYYTLVYDSHRGDDHHRRWVCLDGFTQREVKRRDWGTCYSLLAVSGQFDYDPFVQQMGLLPYGRRDELEDLAKKLEGLDESEFASRYFVSGGNLRDFLLPVAESRQLVEASMCRLTCEDANALLSEYKSSLNEEFDRIRMMGVPDTTNVEQYIDPFCGLMTTSR